MTGSNCRHLACKASALPAELIARVVVTPTGFEPMLSPWKGGVLTAWPRGHGSSSRTRTYDKSVNSRLLYQLSYWGIFFPPKRKMERKTRLELATPTLARWCSTTELLPHMWCSGTELNRRHGDFQSPALPTELPEQKWRPRSDLNRRSSPWQGDMLTATPRGRISFGIGKQSEQKEL